MSVRRQPSGPSQAPGARPSVIRQYVLVEVQTRAPIAGLADKVVGRAWPLADRVDGMLLDSQTAYKLARAQMGEQGA